MPEPYCDGKVILGYNHWVGSSIETAYHEPGELLCVAGEGLVVVLQVVGMLHRED